MLETPEIKKIYSEIQNRLLYMIPEKWDKLCLYASVIEQIRNIPTGELFFYYFPKGILKKEPVNVYEIPNRFNINEEEYLDQMRALFEQIKSLWEVFKDCTHRRWYSITISIENFKFKIEYNYKDIRDLPYNQEEQHTIWAYKYLDLNVETLSKKNRKLIEDYINNGIEEEIETYEEGIYKKPVHNIISYQKVDSIEEDIQNVEEVPEEEVENIEKVEEKKEEKHKKKWEHEEKYENEEEEEELPNNQILMKKK